ncbi:MAG: CBS domain-containing protein [Candidatus Woesearchaeota archaeon]
MNSIREIMNVDVVTASEEQKLTEIIDLITEKKIGCVVVTQGDKPTGILTKSDLIGKVLDSKKDPKKLKVKDVMTSPIITVTPDIEFGDALGVMESNHIKRLVVIEDEVLSGLITNADIVRTAKNINSYCKRMVFYQNIQSYVIFIFFMFALIYFAVKFLMN